MQKNYFYKILGINSISILLKVLMGIISTKLISIYVGLNGISLLEYFRNFTNIAESTSQMGLQNGIVKQIATSDNEKEQEQKIFSTALGIATFSTLFTMLFCLLFSKSLQNFLFQSTLFEVSFLIFLLLLPSSSLQMLTISTLNGKRLFQKIIWINSIGYLINTLLSILLITQWALQGAMLQIALTPAILYLFTWFYAKKQLAEIKFSLSFFDRKIAKNLLGFTLMNVVSSTLAPFSFIFIRNLIDTFLGETDAGIWSSIIRLSGFYMVFVSSICSLYFFPLLAKEEKIQSQRRIFLEYYKKFVPLIGIILLVIFLTQNIIIPLLFTEKFLPLTHYLHFQLIIDFIKSCAFIFGYKILAERKIGAFILYECISIGSQMLLSYICIQNWGLYGIFFANIISISLYLIGVFTYTFRKK